MIIFDDKEFVELLAAGKVPHCKYRNTVLRSCAKMVAAGAYDFDEMYRIICENTNFAENMDESLFASYVETRTYAPPIVRHKVPFGYTEIRNVKRLQKPNERKLYLMQLFCFKYFQTKRIRLSMREFKRLAGIDLRCNTTGYRPGKYIVVRRENSWNQQELKEWHNNKAYLYYYPKGRPGETLFEFEYTGDCFMLPGAEYTGNTRDLYDMYLQALEDYF